MFVDFVMLAGAAEVGGHWAGLLRLGFAELRQGWAF
jgi:hypothetical protein